MNCAEAFDYVLAGQIWAVAFTSVVGLFFVSHGIAQALRMIKNG